MFRAIICPVQERKTVVTAMWSIVLIVVVGWRSGVRPPGPPTYYNKRCR